MSVVGVVVGRLLDVVDVEERVLRAVEDNVNDVVI